MCTGDFPHIESIQCKESFCKTALFGVSERGYQKKEERKRERKKELCLIPPYLITGN